MNNELKGQTQQQRGLLTEKIEYLSKELNEVFDLQYSIKNKLRRLGYFPDEPSIEQCTEAQKEGLLHSIDEEITRIALLYNELKLINEFLHVNI